MELSRNDIHVWSYHFDQVTIPFSQLLQVLSSDELKRADHFQLEKDKRRFILCRALLRMTISHYLNFEPGQIEFSYGAYGKPALSYPFCEDNLEFNLSHSNDLMLFAITRGHKVGIDVEHLRNIPRIELLVERYFSFKEINAFHTLPLHEKQANFFRVWTRKEAYAKAMGWGLAFPLDGIDVCWLVPFQNSHQAFGYSFFDLNPTEGYVASVVVEGSGYRLSCQQ